jgi:ribosomal protein S10
MKSYHLTFLSKNKDSLNSKILFFTNTSALNFNVIKKYFQKKTKKHFLTILKSPHVNKSAQEQFESRVFSKQLTIFSPKKLQYAYLLKKIRNNLFSDVKIKIKCSVNKEKNSNIRLQIFNPDNFKLNINKIFRTQTNHSSSLKGRKIFDNKNNKKTKLFLQILDIYGELTQVSLDSSVGRAKD